MAIVRRETFIIPEKADIDKHGYMEKRGKLNKNWKKRWFVLYCNGSLCYYEHPENTDSKELGEISLYNVNELKLTENENIFSLVTLKRTFELKCDNKYEYQEWVNLIKIKLNPIIIYKGYITKRGEINHSWKLRYFQLVKYQNKKNNIELKYFENDKLTKFKGVIECQLIYKINIISSKEESNKKYGKDNILELMTEKRIYVLNFKTESLRKEWKNILETTIFLNKDNNKINKIVADDEKEIFTDDE